MIAREGTLVVALAWLAVAAAPEPASGQGIDHAAFDSVLQRFVQDGRVDYAALKVGREGLDDYLSQVAAVTAHEFESWPVNERVAYLINAYNAYVLQTIVDHYPITGSGFFRKLTSPKRFSLPANSIRHIDGAFDAIVHEVAGKEMTLDDIQHGALRTDYAEPRLHFALVSSAVSCPPLREEAFRADRLDEQLDDQARLFLNDPRQNRFEVERGQVHLSQIFEWFGDDFRGFASESGYQGNEKIKGVLAFATRYLRERVASFLETGEYRVRFLSYDWTLNDQAVAAATQ
jgi:hypothetical protein